MESFAPSHSHKHETTDGKCSRPWVHRVRGVGKRTPKDWDYEEINLCLSLILAGFDTGKACDGDPRRRAVSSDGKDPVGNRGVFNRLFPGHVVPPPVDPTEPDLVRGVGDMSVDVEAPGRWLEFTGGT